MRQMKKGETTLNIVNHIMTQNLWEYFVTDNKFTDNIVQCLVLGDFDEIGDVDLNEIKPYIVSTTTILTDLLPAPGWEWV